MVQREIEKKGIPTVSPSVALDVTRHSKPPRAMFLPFMMGHLFGVPHHKQLQRLVLSSLLERLADAQASGDIHFFEYTWAQARKEAKQLNLPK